jgi:PKD repeat protein
MKSSHIIIVALISCFLLIGMVQADDTNWSYSTPGTYTWTCPAGVTEITLDLVGAGGSGATGYYYNGGYGGLAGVYSRKSRITTTPGTNYSIVVGDGGENTTVVGVVNDGGYTSGFGYTVTGGDGGTNGVYGHGRYGGNGATGSINTTKYSFDGVGALYASGTGGLGHGAGGGGGGSSNTNPGPVGGGGGADGFVKIFIYGTATDNTPAFEADVTTGIPGTAIRFTDQSFIANSTGLSYNWSFGDGEYSSTPGDVVHVYPYLGAFDVSLTVDSAAGEATETKTSYITIINKEGTTVFYSPKQTAFKVVDKNNNPVIGATVTANFNQSTLPPTEVDWLVSNYGMNLEAANEALDGTLLMTGTTDATGAITFTMLSTLGYDVNVTYGGLSYPFMINTHDNYYLLRLNTGSYTAPHDANNTYTGVANSTLTFSEPNSSYMTMGIDYLDTTGNTDNLIFTIKLENNNTVMYTTSQAVSGATRVLINKTYPNVRGQRWIWYYDAHRTV